ncbi:hypothetical protein ACIOD2_25760 [Amycolatopsis sp. NPDC088138]|uniref:hypothetical protein n=1 Tax=Amycolatopsis sp. NPDC088138 TaxID=3363938 RepID=UPI00381E9B95
MNDLPPYDECTREIVADWYHEQFPLLAAADKIIAQYNGTDSIHEPSERGLSTKEVARAALVFTELPPRCQADIDHAEAYIARLHEEMRDQYPPAPPNLADAVISAEFPLGGCVMSAEQFAELSPEAQDEHVASVAEDIFDGSCDDHMRVLFTQALKIALPAVYAEITGLDEARRRREGFGLVPPAA